MVLILYQGIEIHKTVFAISEMIHCSTSLSPYIPSVLRISSSPNSQIVGSVEV